jgi:glycerol uptake facilitator-like aquaporin
MRKREFIGEAAGTFLLVLFGCGSVAVSVTKKKTTTPCDWPHKLA